MLTSRYSGPRLMTLESIALALEIPLDDLKAIAANKDQFYLPERREPKGNGKFRIINEPIGSLKKLQLGLLKLFFRKVEFASYLSGGIKRKSHVNSVRRHAKSDSVLTEDIRDFFSSYKDRLPQGARTSTALANLVFFDSEPQMVRDFRRMGLKYSRHVDDMNVSSRRPLGDKTIAFVRSRISEILNTRGCCLNEKKHKIQDRSKPCRIHGLLINAGRPTKGRRQIANIRAAIKELESSVMLPLSNQGEFESLFRKALGRVSEIQPYQPVKARPMRIRLDRVKKVALQRWPTFM